MPAKGICNNVVKLHRTSSGTAPVTPATIFGSALALWVRADLGATVVAGTLTALADQSGSGDPLKDMVFAPSPDGAPGYFASSPQELNGQACYGAYFGPGSMAMTCGPWAAPVPQPFWCFRAWVVFGGGANVTFVGLDAGGSLANSAGLIHNTDGAGAGSMTSNSNSVMFSAALDAGHVAGCLYDGVASELWLDAVTAATATGNADTDAVQSMLSGQYPGQPGLYLFAEQFIVSGPITAGQRTAAMQYLGTRYGVPLA